MDEVEYNKFNLFQIQHSLESVEGEEVSKAEIFLSKLAQNYSESVDHKTQVISTFMEPVVIVLLGFVLIAVHLPMFQLWEGLGEAIRKINSYGFCD